MKFYISIQLKSISFFVCTLLATRYSAAQSLSVNTTGAAAHSSAILDVSSTVKGVLIPRISLTSINDVATIATPATSLLVYNSNAAITGGSGLGYYYFDGVKWVKVIDASTALNTWGTTGNTGTSTATNFIGTTDNVGLVFKVKGFQSGYLDITNLNTSFGERSLIANTSGTRNAALGYYALFSNTTGFDNAAIGYRSLYNNSTGFFNTVIGSDAMYSNTTGHENIVIGYKALYLNTTGDNNASAGTFSMYTNTTGSGNAAFGNGTLYSNTSGGENTALGNLAMSSNTTGEWNTAVGSNALFANSTGRENTAAGISALLSNTTGNYNTASGSQVMFLNTTGSFNVAMGWGAMHDNSTGSGNTAIGSSALNSNTTGGSNTALGLSAIRTNTTGNDNTAIGVAALSTNSTGDNNTSTGSNSLNKNTTGANNTSAGFGSLFNNTTGFQNTAIGATSILFNTTGSYHTAVGYNTGPSAGNLANTTSIGIDASCTASDRVRIGNTFVNSIGGQVGWTTISDGRFKENIKEDVPGLSFITGLRPVSYQLNRDKINDMNGVNERRKQIANDAKNKTGVPQFLSGDTYSETTTGFIAQEVEAIAQKLDFNFSGIDRPRNDKDFYGLRYAEFVVPLVKGMQEQQQMIEAQNNRIAILEKELKELKEKIK
jgi:hypothetical protein